jgi:pectate lyase
MRPELRSAKQKLLGTNSSTQTRSNNSSILTIRRNWYKRLPSRMLRQAYMVLGLSISFLL